MSIDRAVIKRLLERLLTVIARVERMEFTLAEIQQDIDVQDLISFRLQQAVEISTDVAMHIVATLRLGSPDSGKDVMDDLAQAKIISRSLADQMKSGVGFRNIVVHRYADVDFRNSSVTIETT